MESEGKPLQKVATQHQSNELANILPNEYKIFTKILKSGGSKISFS